MNVHPEYPRARTDVEAAEFAAAEVLRNAERRLADAQRHAENVREAVGLEHADEVPGLCSWAQDVLARAPGGWAQRVRDLSAKDGGAW